MQHKTNKEHIKKSLIFESAVLLGLIISILISSTASFQKKCGEVRQSVLRLHVIANSDSQEDQELKLKVRDAVLETGSSLFSGSADARNAEEKAIGETEKLEEAAIRTLRENGCGDDVKIEVGQSWFPTRTYGDVTLPAGKYEAVRVIIGSGKGHNWWCVMFPPMCLPAAEEKKELDDVLSKDAAELVRSDPKFEIRFKIVEWYEWAKEKLSSRSA
ncbi:MAG: stage II sporulation protein R [Acutalibacteraceae bacterium]|nr:stage II sporulation protein R [Oscillospiraceae bacterium]